MTRLSVNINKIATIRNARGGNIPNIKQAAIDCQKFGAEGITIHPRPDERHIRYQDVYDIKPIITTEFNIEGYPTSSFIDLVAKIRPTQVTLVPDPPDVLTSNAGWETIKHKDFLKEVIIEFKKNFIVITPINSFIFQLLEQDSKMYMVQMKYLVLDCGEEVKLLFGGMLSQYLSIKL